MAKDYNASLFSIYSDGVTNNTGSIQKAIDFISGNGGGRLVFYVGRYMTGTVQLKSNVTIRLEEGAVLVGAPSIYDYKSNPGSPKAIVTAYGQSNIGISGKGVMDGNASIINQGMQNLIRNNYIAAATDKPSLVAFSNCSNIAIDSIHLWQSANAALVFNQCNKVLVDQVNIDGKNTEAGMGIWLQNTSGAIVQNSFIAVTGSPITQSGTNKDIQIVKTINPQGQAIENVNN